MSICEEKTCREMTARNEIEVLEIDEKLKDRILRKYDDEKAKQAEYNHYEIRRLEKLIEQKASSENWNILPDKLILKSLLDAQLPISPSVFVEPEI